MVDVDKLNVPSTPSVSPWLFLMLIPNSTVLTTSDLKNLEAGTSVSRMFSASAFLAVPYSFGSACVTSTFSSVMLIPVLITGKPTTVCLGVNVFLLKTITGKSST